MLRIPAPVALLVVAAALPVLAVAPASADDPAGALGNVVINEVSSNGYNHGATTNRDFVELYNHGTANIDLSGYHLTDSSGLPASDIVLGGVLPAGGYAVIWNNEASAGAAAFGLGGSDRIDLLSPDGATTIDSHSWATHVAPSHARVPDGTGALAVSTAATPGGSNALATADAMVTLNEYSSSTDFVELHNAGPSAVSLEGWSIADGATEVQGDEILFGAGVEIPAGGYLSVPTEGPLPAGVTYVAGGFGLNMTDHVWLRNGADALVSTTWVGFEADGVTTRHADPSWARTSQGVGLWKAFGHRDAGRGERVPRRRGGPAARPELGRRRGQRDLLAQRRRRGQPRLRRRGRASEQGRQPRQHRGLVAVRQRRGRRRRRSDPGRPHGLERHRPRAGCVHGHPGRRPGRVLLEEGPLR